MLLITYCVCYYFSVDILFNVQYKCIIFKLFHPLLLFCYFEFYFILHLFTRMHINMLWLSVSCLKSHVLVFFSPIISCIRMKRKIVAVTCTTLNSSTRWLLLLLFIYFFLFCFWFIRYYGFIHIFCWTVVRFDLYCEYTIGIFCQKSMVG